MEEVSTKTLQVTDGADRPRREPLTKGRIIQAALRIMDAEGLDGVTMRRVGRELGVEAMSLYNHVRDKDDILAGVCEEVLSSVPTPPVDDWEEAARQAAHGFRRALLEHPHVITLMTGRKQSFTNPESLRTYDYVLDLFHRAGLSGAEWVKAFHTFGGYIMGSVAMELGLLVDTRADEAHDRTHQEMARVIMESDLPRLREALPHFMDCDTDAQFQFGLTLLIEGLRSMAAEHRGGTAGGSP